MPFVQVQFRFGETVTVDQVAHELDLIAEEFDVAAVAVPGIEIQRGLRVAAGFEEGIHRRQIVADMPRTADLQVRKTVFQIFCRRDIEFGKLFLRSRP